MLDADSKAALGVKVRQTARELFGDYEKAVLLPPPPKRRAGGPIQLGRVIYGPREDSFGLRAAELLQGLGIYGRSGSGKTNLVLGLLLQLERARIPFLFLDWKQTCRHFLPSLRRRVGFYTPGKSIAPFSFNPLIPPPGTEIRTHVAQITDILCAAYALGEGAKSVLQKAISQVFVDSSDAPRLSDVRDLIEAREHAGRASGWKASALRALDSLLLLGQAPVGDSAPGELVERLIQTSSVVELDGLNDSAKKFLVPALMMWLYRYRLRAPDRERLRLVVIVEEAHHLLFRSENRSEESIMNKFLRQCRELGIGVVVVDQHPHLISSAALGNTHTSICLSQKEPSDLNRASAISMLADDEKPFLSRLSVGEGIVKMQDRWHLPFLVRFPLMRVQKGSVTDLHLEEYVAEGRRAIKELAPERLDDGHTLRPSMAIGSPGFRLLLDCIAYPTDGMQARYSRLRMSAAKGNRLKVRLLRTGLAEGTLIPVGKTRRFILQPTAKAAGLRMLDATQGRGSPEHEFWRHRYAEALKKAGWKVELEAARVGGRVDVAGSKDGRRVGIEIETGKSDALGNLQNCLKSDLDRVLVVATNESALRRIKADAEKCGVARDPSIGFVLRDEHSVEELVDSTR